MPKPIGAVGTRGKVAAELQTILADLIALSLQDKQAHWNVRGPQFGPLHELFDRMSDAHRGWYDDVAERARALGAPADGRLKTVAAATNVKDLPAGEMSDRDAVADLLERVEGLIGRIRTILDVLGEWDPVTQDLVIGVVRGLEAQAWILRSQSD